MAKLKGGQPLFFFLEVVESVGAVAGARLEGRCSLHVPIAKLPRDKVSSELIFCFS